MLIFDRFENRAGAERFAQAATEMSGLGSVVCSNYRQFDEHEVFPFGVTFPVALVQRAGLTDLGSAQEDMLVKLVLSFGGQFTGT